MTITWGTLGKWLRLGAACAAAVIGSLGTGTLPTDVRSILVAFGAGLLTLQHYLSTTSTGTAQKPPAS